MLELPAVNWAPRRMLPPPMTMAICDAVLRRPIGLAGDVHDLLHADAALAGRGKALAGELQDDPAIGRSGEWLGSDIVAPIG